MVKMRDYGKLQFLPTMVSAVTVNMDDKFSKKIPKEDLKPRKKTVPLRK